ncbi:unnamed protein product [Effrenium voratum]|nr:unnamed protein product [Effrenium voratum]
MEGEDRRARTPEPEPLARPSSPWHYQLKRRDANSPARASRALGSTGSAATARAANVVHAAARASYEGAMLAAVRRQMESLEEKVEKQLSRQAQDRGREAAVQRLEEKLQATETLQPKVERRLAELSGNFKGLSDEMQAQIRRVDLLDDRRWEWRHQVEEELAKKCQQQEQQVQLLAAGLKTQKGLEDEAAKLLESEVRERATLEQVREGFVNVCGRLEALEAQREEPSRSEVRDVAPSDDFVATSIYEVITKRMEDLERRMEEAFQDNREIHGRMASQEEMMKTLRTLFENREDHLRTLGERVERSDWDLKLEAIRQALQEDHRERTAHAERLELLTKRVEYQEQAIEDVCFVREQVHKEAEPEVSVALLEDQVKALSLELQEMKSENDLGPRVSALLSQLRERSLRRSSRTSSPSGSWRSGAKRRSGSSRSWASCRTRWAGFLPRRWL